MTATELRRKAQLARAELERIAVMQEAECMTGNRLHVARLRKYADRMEHEADELDHLEPREKCAECGDDAVFIKHSGNETRGYWRCWKTEFHATTSEGHRDEEAKIWDAMQKAIREVKEAQL